MSNAPVRRHEDSWEYRCPHCLIFWPLDDEFWWPLNMARCRACQLVVRREKERARFRADATLRARRLLANRAYRAEVGRDIPNLKRWIRYWKDPEAERARVRARYQANREAINAARRAAYKQDRAA